MFIAIKGRVLHICIPVKCWLILEVERWFNFSLKTENKHSTNSLGTSHEIAHRDGPTNSRDPHVAEPRLNLGFEKAQWSSCVSGATN